MRIVADFFADQFEWLFSLLMFAQKFVDQCVDIGDFISIKLFDAFEELLIKPLLNVDDLLVIHFLFTF